NEVLEWYKKRSMLFIAYLSKENQADAKQPFDFLDKLTRERSSGVV
ncbi:MAG: hypothetical protein H2184_01240, partial [Candidatus Galacturonibacter soehngenii]|nr:hypothetical protein [Candidatus Galacturonibacter soehngenii]